MQRFSLKFLVVTAFVLTSGTGVVQAQSGDNLAIAGHINSLWNHALHSTSKRTSVSSWLDTMQAANGHRYAERMEFGFFDSFAAPPNASSTGNVNGGSGISALGSEGWSKIQYGFNGTARGGDIVFSSDNFGMGVVSPPRMKIRPSDDGNLTPQRTSYIEAASDLIAGYEANVKAPKRYWIFSGLPGFDEYSYGTWPSDTNIEPWKVHVRGDWTDWQTEFVEGLRTANPGYEIGLINAAEVFVDTWENVVPDMTHTDWFEDLAPHGHPDTYAVLAAIVYSTFFQAEAPDISKVLGRASVDPRVVQNWTKITDYVNRAVNG
ncbi:hypothetical protein [Ruegeria arenilitoris]|uniref:hypothetical protein n=1 Tax=Ruegeria arenilitoris TaxID=1173585 RepID=UPI0014807C40|nr:hypothetical protein [Ruegeria arenilitoris]